MKTVITFIAAILIYISMRLANWSNMLLEYMDTIGAE